MAQHRIRRMVAGTLAVGLALVVAACGGSASPAASTPASTAPSVASVAPSIEASPAAGQSTAASPAVDAAADVKISAPYGLVPLPAAAQSIFEQQMAASLAATGGRVSLGFRQVTGGTSPNTVLFVLGFPAGQLTDVTYGAFLGAMTATMKADATKTTVSGVDVSSATTPTGTLALYHDGDRVIMVVAGAADALDVAKALISAR